MITSVLVYQTYSLSGHLRPKFQDPHSGVFLSYLEGQEDLVSRLITPIIHIVTPIILVINLYFLSPHDPPSKLLV